MDYLELTLPYQDLSQTQDLLSFGILSNLLSLLSMGFPGGPVHPERGELGGRGLHAAPAVLFKPCLGALSSEHTSPLLVLVLVPCCPPQLSTLQFHIRPFSAQIG